MSEKREHRWFRPVGRPEPTGEFEDQVEHTREDTERKARERNEDYTKRMARKQALEAKIIGARPANMDETAWTHERMRRMREYHQAHGHPPCPTCKGSGEAAPGFPCLMCGGEGSTTSIVG